MKEGLNTELKGLNSQPEIQNYLKELNINTKISKEERRLRELEIVEILNAAYNLPNDTPITDVKKTLDKLIKIKQNNESILTESNNQIIDELITRFNSIFNKSTNSSTFEKKLQNFQANKEKYRNSEDLEILKELLEKVKKLLLIKGISEDNKKQLKLEKRLIQERIRLLNNYNLQGIVSTQDLNVKNRLGLNNLNQLNSVQSKKNHIKFKKARKADKTWYSKINNILFNTDTIPVDEYYINNEDLYKRKEKVNIQQIIQKLEKNLESSENNKNKKEKTNEINRLTKKIQKGRTTTTTISRINKYVLKFIDDIAEPLLKKISKNNKKSKFLTEKGREINTEESVSKLAEIKRVLLEIFRRSFGDLSSIPISELFYNFFISFNRYPQYEKFLKISYQRENNDDSFVISFY